MGLFLYAAPRVPQERRLELRIYESEEVQRLDFTVTRADDAITPVAGGSFAFEDHAPPALDATVDLPEGDYEIEVVTTGPAGPSTSREPLVIPGDEPIRISVRRTAP